ncbi:uncharacterized protein STEHIDRAFT_152913 [Stereum hirsutum FP-91666 SS1]|uniref:uncharacterized protein n=1 Tax=Stereum hirsutum (strain FP-91666) TaxID=721885 RepID=UPI000440FF58|nr:uncharacterized protein STEHIDRAFT_152913 [Stereum hirsutum FP-91666 SS1]EIM91262.1 hypothetical protein STEHIDRAFT_152913 [Stereum hirsutum FP-91666 SS1]
MPFPTLSLVTATLVVGSILSPLCQNSAYAALYATKPFSATNYTAGQTELVTWMEDGNQPSLAGMGTFKIDLWMGGGAGENYVTTVAQNVNAQAMQQNIVINPSVGSDSSYYYLRLMFDNPPSITYTSMFTITGMSGSAPAPTTVSGTSSGVSAAASAPYGFVHAGSSTSSMNATATSTSNSSMSALNATASQPPYLIATTVSASPITRSSPAAPMVTGTKPPVQEEKDKNGLANSTSTAMSGAQRKTNAAGSAGMQRPSMGGYGWERMKFQMVFILWPALMGITMAL